MASKKAVKREATMAGRVREATKAARMKKDPMEGADDFNKIPLGKAADTAAMVSKKEKDQASGKKAGKAGKTEKPVKDATAAKKPAADQKKKQQRRGK